MVSDTGIGIPREQQEDIFKAFVQRSEQNHAQYGGTGLGLAITQRLVNMMGGLIHVRSQEGRGSEFSVILPQVAFAQQTMPNAPAQTPKRNSLRLFAPAKILIVDDTDTNRKLFQAYLRKQPNLQLLFATNGQEAIDMAWQERPDLILMDMKMPGIDGKTAVARIRRHADFSQLPIIFVTASAMVETEQALRLVSDGFLKKPVHKEALLKELGRFLAYTDTDTSPSNHAAVTAASPPSNAVATAILPKNNAPVAKPLDIEILCELLAGQQQAVWQRLNPGAINQVEAFGQTMQTLGDTHQYQPLSDWGERLQQQAMSFDMLNLEATLKEFPTILQNLRQLQD